jgi:ethanolamine utilization protein EutN
MGDDTYRGGITVMLIARIIGTVVATRKHEQLVGRTIQIVQPLEAKGDVPKDDPFVAIDAVGAGVGEMVIVVRGSGARKAADNDQCPVDATIIGIVDTIDIDGGE